MAKLVKLQDLLEQDKARLLEDLDRAGSPLQAVSVLESETDRLLMRYNEAACSERERETAASILQAARMTLPAIDSVGETKIWELAVSDSGHEQRHLNPAAITALGTGALAVSCLIMFLNTSGVNGTLWSILHVITAAAGGIMLFRAGQALKQKKLLSAPKRDIKTENLIDSSKLYRIYQSMVMVADRNLDFISPASDPEVLADNRSLIEKEALSDQEAELYSDLLEAAYTGDGEYALEKLGMVRHYLHRRGVDIIDYSDETAKYFDVMPSKHDGTIRPALLFNDRVLRKGVAAENMFED